MRDRFLVMLALVILAALVVARFGGALERWLIALHGGH